MVFMGDRATLLETGRFVQRHARNAADEIIEAVGLQKMGRSLQLPIAVLPAAGIINRLGQDDVF
ncbi:hypothetical protein ABT034_34910, partial [Streptomyces sp. NPDC002773]